MSYLDAMILGIIQGLTEFLPVSSSGHLVVLQNWLGHQSDSPEMLTFDVVSHLGTLLAIAIVFRRPLTRFLTNRRHSPRIALLALVATGVTGVVGMACQDWFESLFGQPRLVGVAFVLTGAILYITTGANRPRRGWRQFSFSAAGVVGLAQAIAITPGISRSGVTICAAMLLGLRRRWAAEFSFLIAAPAIVGATILKLNDFLGAASDVVVGPLVLGGTVSFVVGLVALPLLLRMVHRSRLHWFSYYLWPLGLFVLILGAP